MKVSYITIGNALDIHNWSGLEYFIAKALEKGDLEIDYIGNLKINNKQELKRIFYRLIGKRYDIVRDRKFAEQCASYIKKLLKPDTDIIFSPGTVATSLLETKIPKVIYSDATFGSLINFYFDNLCEETIKMGNFLDQTAYDSAKLIIFSSEWAAQAAISQYKVETGKIAVVPFGANIEKIKNLKQTKLNILSRSNNECSLLFIGVDWERKGGDLAVKITKRLNESGVKTTLHIVGVRNLPTRNLPRFCVNHGFISKKFPEGREKIEKLLSSSHFLLLPTQAEAYGLVFCEANAFALPSISTNVGGVPTIIKNNVNGKLFELCDTEDKYVNYIKEMMDDRKSYEELALSSYNEYLSRLNWKVSGNKINQLLKQISK